MLMPKTSETKTDFKIFVVGIFISIGFLIFDLSLPLGVACGIPYVSVILLTFWMTKPKFTLAAGILSTILIMVGFYLSPKSGIYWVVILNRALALFGVWIAVLFILTHKKTSRKLKKSENIFEVLFESISEGILLTDKEGKIVSLNNSIKNLFGFEKEDLLGNNFDILIPERYKKNHESKWKEFMSDPIKRTMGSGKHFKAIDKYGKEFPVNIALNPVVFENEKFTMSIVTDITELVKKEEKIIEMNSNLEKKVISRTEELAQAIKELQDSNNNLTIEIEKRKEAEEKALKSLEKEKELHEMKTRFVSMASHEFRTPLSGVLTSISLISRYTDNSQIEKRNKHIKRIKNAVHTLTGILEDFLSFDKLESGKIKADPVNFNLIAFIDEVIENMSLESKTAQRIVHCHNSKEKEDNKIYQDKRLLNNILTNLLSNAIKYSEEGSKIEIHTHLNEHELSISVKDYGIGIPDIDRQHIFERFFRAKNATNIQGTGLGLNIVKKHLELLGGNIHFKSNEDSGSTFQINFPKHYSQ